MRGTLAHRIGLFSMLVACVASSAAAQTVTAREPIVTAVSHCREHISLRNASTVARTVTVTAADGTSRRVLAHGRDDTTNLPYAATIVVLPSVSDSTKLSVEGQSDTYVRASLTPCVRPLPTSNPDDVEVDYTFASLNSSRPDEEPWLLTGLAIVTFADSATRADVDSLIRSKSMALVGGHPGMTPASDAWVFWIEDGPDNSRTRQLIGELRQSDLVRVAWPYFILYSAHELDLVLEQPCETRLIVRNASARARQVSWLDDRHGQRVQHEIPPTLGSRSVSVVLRVPAGIGIEVDGHRASFERSAVPCVAPLPAMVPDSVPADYTTQNAQIQPLVAGTQFPGLVLVSFSASTTRAQRDSIVLSEQLELVGGVRIGDSGRGIWTFWVPDGAGAANAHDLAKRLRSVPGIHSASTTGLRAFR